MKFNLHKIVKSFGRGLKKHSPEILTGIGIAGMITTAVLAVKATPKAEELIKKYKENEEKEELTAVETIKAAWKPYIPAAITCGISVLCLVGASSEHLRRNTALAAAYTLSESARKEYRKKVIETIGEEDEKPIRDAVIKERLDSDPPREKEIIITGNGNVRCYDAWSGNYFESDINSIKKAVNELNRQMLSDMYISLNEFYAEIGFKEMPVMGDRLGWNVDKGLIDVEFSSQLDDKGMPCLVMIFTNEPVYDY